MARLIKPVSPTKKKKNEPPLLEKLDQKILFNRELSWLEFNRRVLQESLDEANPLLERLKFLSIFSTNLDEFFMIRVAGLKEQIEDDINELSLDGLTALEQLGQLRMCLLPLLSQQLDCLENMVLPRLAESGITVNAYETLAKEEKKRVDEYFLKNVFPVLTPQAVDSSHPFPYVSNLSLN